MDTLLNNPIYYALLTGNKSLAKGTDAVKFFDKEVSPLVGLKDNSPADFQSLFELITYDEPVIFMATGEVEIPAPWKVLQLVKGLEMIYNNTEGLPGDIHGLVELTQEHVPQMVALTKLTNPGPFASRTIEFGHYYGLFDGDKLVAMAGQRLHIGNYMEISAVCTHPDHLGRGYARQLLAYHVNRIIAASGIPILHVRGDNERAITLYEKLGFVKCADAYFYIIQKQK